MRTCPTRQHSSMVTSARQSLETGKHTWSSPELSGYRLSDPFKTQKLCSLLLVARSALSPVFSRSTVDFFFILKTMQQHATDVIRLGFAP